MDAGYCKIESGCISVTWAFKHGDSNKKKSVRAVSISSTFAREMEASDVSSANHFDLGIW